MEAEIQIITQAALVITGGIALVSLSCILITAAYFAGKRMALDVIGSMRGNGISR